MEKLDKILVPIRFECKDCSKYEELLSNIKNNTMTEINCINYEISLIIKRKEDKYEVKLIILCKKCNNYRTLFSENKEIKFLFKCQYCSDLNGIMIYYKILDPNLKPIKLKFINDTNEHCFNFSSFDSIKNKFDDIKKVFKNINSSTKFYFNSMIIDVNQSFEQNQIYDCCEIEIRDG